MNRVLQTLFSLTFSINVYGQEVIVKTIKNEYIVNETISLSFEVNAIVDSVSKLEVNNFRIIGGPRKGQVTSTINGVTSISYSLSYEIKASSPGSLEIISPIFYIDNQKYQAQTLKLIITGKKLTSKEIDDIEFNEFKNYSVKPNGTLRYVFFESYGYIEEYKVDYWGFKRRLTKSEIKKLRNK